MGSLFSPSQQTSTQQNQQSGTSTATGERTGRQEDVFNQVLAQLLPMVQQGPQVLQSDRNMMRTGINNKYNQTYTPQVESGLTSRGFGDSGKLGAAFKNLGLARAGEFQSGEAGLRSAAQDRYAHLLGLALPFMTPTSTTTDFNQSGSGTSTQPGASIFDKILGGAGQAAGIALALGA
jgi:hypothetical protein